MTKAPLALICAAALASLAGSSLAQTFTFSGANPWMDRWQYPFASGAGTRATAPTFTTLWANNTGTAFDDRDGEFLLGFRTAPQTNPVRSGVPSGFPASRYRVNAATLRIVASPSAAWLYDPTQDAVTTYLNPGDPAAVPPVAPDPLLQPDADAGRPVELYAVAFRGGFTSATYLESSPFRSDNSSFRGTRNAYPVDFGGATLAARDVSNNVSIAGGYFEVQPLAVGTTSRTPGDPVQDGDAFTFAIDVTNIGVQEYLRTALSTGNLSLAVSSLHPASPFGGGPITYPEWATRENLIAGNRPTLAMTAQLCIADIAGPDQSIGADGLFTADDVIVFLAGYFGGDLLTADVAGANQALGPNGALTADDVIVFLGAFFASCN